MRAAAEVGSAARPLPLFYAVSQAGRAIAAARLEDPWRLAGHGLKVRAPEDTSAGLLRHRVKPDGGPTSGERRQAFAGVAEATGSAQLTRRAAGGGCSAGPQPSALAQTHTSACVGAPAPASAGRGDSASGDTATDREVNAASAAPRKSAISSIYLSPSLSARSDACTAPPVGNGAPCAARRPKRPTEIPATGRNVPTNSTAPTEREQIHPLRDAPSLPPIRSQLPA
jgi:hypothetical protein